MKVNAVQDYSRFYKGTEQLKSYGSEGGGITAKDTLVKYAFDATDEQGNKVTENMSKEESLQAMKEISSQYGDNVIVEFSGSGLEALSKSVREQIEKGEPQLTPEQEADRAAKQKLLDESIVHLENTHRLIIPNIQTNQKLYNSLEDAPEQVVKAANGVIKNHLMPHDVSGMTEEQRKDRISFGLEEAKYLAENYLDEEHAADFLSAMDTIAKYGMNATVSEDGKAAYHIKKGPMVGMSDDYVDQFLNSSPGTGGLSLYDRAAVDYQTWKKNIDDTELPAAFSNVKYTGLTSFFDSLKTQSSLSDSWLAKEQERFTKWLEME